jgi:hypothetical protein
MDLRPRGAEAQQKLVADDVAVTEEFDVEVQLAKGFAVDKNLGGWVDKYLNT